MKHCIECGSDNQTTDNHKKTCNQCGNIFYLNPSAAAAVIIYQGDKMLFARRGRNPGKGMLGGVGGFVDPGESLEAAALRELFEESKISKDNISDFRYVGSECNKYEFQNRTMNTICAYFAAELKEGITPEAGDDAQTLEWFHIDEVAVEDFAWPEMWQIAKSFSTNYLGTRSNHRASF